jgi:LacI family transcriptional regulator, repressor for deo operon, udp, cdd, tsx, nupC, and nupG
MRIRLQDVASLAGVSESTVSRVMNGKAGVGDRTRTSVLRILAELGYAPAALHPTPRAGLIGLIVPELDNPIFPTFVQAIEARLLAKGYVCVLCCASRAGATEDDYVETLLGRGVAGVIVVSGRHADVRGDHSVYTTLGQRGIPLVLINGALPGSGIPAVSTDDRGAAVMAYEHLRALGHERIGMVTGPSCYTPVIRKIEGFRRAAIGAGTDPGDVDELIAESMFTLEGGHAGAERLIANGVTGIVAASDMMALGAIRAAREHDLTVPGDVSIVGYDDTDLMRFTDPPLTTIRQPVSRIAEHASSVLLAQIEGQPADRHETLFPGELIARSTTARCSTFARLGN